MVDFILKWAGFVARFEGLLHEVGIDEPTPQ
jgi:hypothetical protein